MEYGSQLLFFFTIAYVIGHSMIYASDSTEHNVKAGLVGAALVFLAQGSLKSYKTPFVRVKDRWCRVGARTGLIYIGLLVFVLFQKVGDARKLPEYIEPAYGKELPMRSENYDRNCEFTYLNVAKIVDFYFIVHFVNWLLAAFIIRDYYVLHFWSVLDELIELSLKNIRPNFAECWWDSLILDVLVANTLGIYIGMKCIDWMGSMKYDWLGRSNTTSWKQWRIWTSHRHFQGLWCLLLFVSFNFVTGFTVNNSLWVPPSSKLNIVRLLIWFIIGALGFREAYDDVRTWGTELRSKKLISAQYRWTAWMMECLEICISWKFRENAGNRLDETVLWPVAATWIVAVGGTLAYWVYLRFFYKFRVYKDGKFMDQELQLSNKKE